MAIHERAPLVEHRKAWTLGQAELNLYETNVPSYEVPLKFGDTVLTSMIRGKKVMHLRENRHFDYLPGEALLMPAGEPMYIDFPDAQAEEPTQCLALTISSEFIRNTVDQFNQYFPRLEEGSDWELYDQNYHFSKSEDMVSTLQRIMSIFREDHVAKDHFAQQALQELLLRVMQTKARHLLIDHAHAHASHHRLAFAVTYIRENLDQAIHVDELCDKACLSRAQFFKAFKKELGVTPVDFVNRERIKRAKRLLSQPGKTITDACYECGFNSLSYFNRVFRRWTGMAPTNFMKKHHA